MLPRQLWLTFHTGHETLQDYTDLKFGHLEHVFRAGRGSWIYFSYFIRPVYSLMVVADVCGGMVPHF